MSQELLTQGSSALKPMPMDPEQEAKAAEMEAMAVLTQAKTVIVTNDEEYRAAGASFATIKAMLKNLEARRVAITGPINQSLKLINEGFKRPKETLERALAHYEAPMIDFQREQDRIRRAAEETARRERERLEAEAREAARAAFEESERLRKQAEQAQAAAATAADPFEQLLAEQAAEEAQSQADAKLEEAKEGIRESRRVEVPAPYVPVARAAGTAVRRPWKFEITDPTLIPREYLIPDEKKIGELARSLKEKAAIPGVAFFEDMAIGGR